MQTPSKFVLSDRHECLSLISFTAGYYAVANVPTPAVPEPEAYAMLLAGLGVVGAIARRRNAKR
jgi:hypothetical protein